MKELSLERFQLATHSPRDRAALYHEPVLGAMRRFQIDGLFAVSAFLATITIESNRLQTVQESLYYRDPARVARIYLRHFDVNKDRIITPAEIESAKAYTHNHDKLSKLLYNGYHGRGLIQLTWKENYVAAMMDLDYDYVSNPDLVLVPFHAALTAGWYWQRHGCSACGDDIRKVTSKVNPALMHLAERTAAYKHAKEVLA